MTPCFWCLNFLKKDFHFLPDIEEGGSTPKKVPNGDIGGWGGGDSKGFVLTSCLDDLLACHRKFC